jgi:hypothetical protein
MQHTASSALVVLGSDRRRLSSRSRSAICLIGSRRSALCVQFTFWLVGGALATWFITGAARGLGYEMAINDPAKGAAAIYAAVTAGQPPIRFQVGPDAVAMVEDKLTRVRAELEAWRPLASSTLFTAVADSKSA